MMASTPCSAKNKHGTATKTYDIVVNSTSNITVDDTGSIDSVDILNITENSVTFLVKTSGDPKNNILLDTKKNS
ncbi:hypothetical protein CEXT_691631 [Caerostris extrusa]|uniref:Uncharacterized protein n=1 Tax=Caerostris extrusa TaxID=172846 RepID=A0AAV4SIN7_CAEEX|nr:hypothetical protein CEXT_691631 [Caerostris extrusa]